MSYKQFSATQDAIANGSADEKTKEAPAVDQPAVQQPATAPVETTPASKA